MDKNDLFSLSFILIVVVAILAVSPDVAHDNIVAYATLDGDQIVIRQNSNILLDVGGVDYVLSLYRVTTNRKFINFKLYSYPLSAPNSYQNYFRMDLKSRSATFFNDPKPAIVYPNKYKSFEFDSGNLNIELVSIGSNKATIKIDIT